jgi:hypothetical protein
MRNQLERFHKIEYEGLEDFIRKTRLTRPSAGSLTPVPDSPQRKFTRNLVKRALKVEKKEGMLRMETGKRWGINFVVKRMNAEGFDVNLGGEYEMDQSESPPSSPDSPTAARISDGENLLDFVPGGQHSVDSIQLQHMNRPVENMKYGSQISPTRHTPSNIDYHTEQSSSQSVVSVRDPWGVLPNVRTEPYQRTRTPDPIEKD